MSSVYQASKEKQFQFKGDSQLNWFCQHRQIETFPVKLCYRFFPIPSIRQTFIYVCFVFRSGAFRWWSITENKTCWSTLTRRIRLWKQNGGELFRIQFNVYWRYKYECKRYVPIKTKYNTQIVAQWCSVYGKFLLVWAQRMRRLLPNEHSTSNWISFLVCLC